MLGDPDENEIGFYEAEDKPYGQSYGSWTVKWWQWAMSAPKHVNPVLDQTGRFAEVNQPLGVWFLAGKFGSENSGPPKRRCTIPEGRSILFPVINCEANSFEYPELGTEEELLDHVSRDTSTILTKSCLINGLGIPPQRVKSDPTIFLLSVSEDLEGKDKGQKDIRSVADGYWIFLKPLPRGKYELVFSGSCENGRLNSGAHYEVNVI